MGREQISSLTWSSGVGQALWGTQTAKFLSADGYVNDLHVDANARPQGHLKFIGPAPGCLLLCKSPGAGHTFRCKSLPFPVLEISDIGRTSQCAGQRTKHDNARRDLFNQERVLTYLISSSECDGSFQELSSSNVADRIRVLQSWTFHH